MAWKETPLGGCVQLEACHSRITKSFIECITCNNAIHKKEKIESAIFHQSRFVEMLKKDSVEFRTEQHDLDILKKYYNTLKG